MKAPPAMSHSETTHARGPYRRLNRLLDQAVVPYTVNESLLVTLRETLCREGRPASACYWLLMARLVALALRCAGHYADCGEILAAGDLMFNPRRIDIHVRGAHRPIVKDRHGRLSEQLNPDGSATPEFTAWARQNTITRIVEPALIPDLYSRLEHSGWFSKALLVSFKACMAQVADAMRFGSTTGASSAKVGQHALRWGRFSEDDYRQMHQCRFETTCFRRLGHDVEQTVKDATYRSAYLSDPRTRERVMAAALAQDDRGPRGQIPYNNATGKEEPCHVDRRLFAG